MSVQQLSIILSGLATLAIFSFIFKENAFYRFFEHAFIGIASAWGVLLTIKNFLYPVILSPLLGLDRVPFPDGTFEQPYDTNNLFFLIPLAIGALYYTIYIPKLSWLSQIAIGVSLGMAGGLSFQGFFNQMIPQVESSMKPLVVLDATTNAINGYASLNNIIFVFTLLTVMTYFFFTLKKTGGSPIIQYPARAMLMICFGAYFGSTVMARMALLVERIDFLLTDFYPTVRGVLGL